MSVSSLRHLSDRALLHQLGGIAARDSAATAELLACLAEVEERKLYLAAAHPSLHAYCVQVLHMDEEVAFKRIRAARVVRDFPALIPAVADRRLTLTALILLAPRLTPANVEELAAAAWHLTRSGIERLLAERFPAPDAATRIEPVAEQVQLDPDPVGNHTAAGAPQLDSDPVRTRARVKPLAPRRYALQVTIGESTHEKLLRVQGLLSHRIPSGDLAALLDHVLGVALRDAEKKRFGATSRPRAARRPRAGGRHIPAAMRRAVRERDGDQCRFVSESGQRCSARHHLQFDHIEPVASGGAATTANLRLLCRAHNQYAAEQKFGTGFMSAKRREADETRERAAAEKAAIAAQEREMGYALHRLGYRKDEIRGAAALCARHASAPLEERLKLALRSLAPTRGITRVPAPAIAAP